MRHHQIVTKRIADLLGFKTYTEIMKMVREVNVSSCDCFRRKFVDYYKVRRNPDWLNSYFEYFQQVKDSPSVCFDTIIDYIYNNMHTNRKQANPVEPSFSSKMLATIKPDHPILDSQVLDSMKLSVSGETPEERLRSAKTIYTEICQRYAKYLVTDDCNEMIALFDSYFPDYQNIPAYKKIDWFLWSFSREELKEIGKFGDLLCKS